MNITLYHGSKDIIKKPFLHKGKTKNDYGQGFYCTDEKDLAMEWAVRLKKDGFCNIYKLSLNKLTILELDEYPTLVWVAILLKNRGTHSDKPLTKAAYNYIVENYMIDYQKYDLIHGYRADDSYYRFVNDFLSNSISLEELELSLKLGQLGKQYFLQTRKAFSQLSYAGYLHAYYEKYYLSKVLRENIALNQYSDMLANRNNDGVFIKDIINRKEHFHDK